jgi:hypothetical protein
MPTRVATRQTLLFTHCDYIIIEERARRNARHVVAAAFVADRSNEQLEVMLIEKTQRELSFYTGVDTSPYRNAR